MQSKKKNLLDMIVKKDYNNELEKILEEKQYGENVKSTLLSILYKIEGAYKDLQTVKKDVETKEEYISRILDIIQNDCNKITILKMSDKSKKIPKDKTFVVDKEKKEIIAYPIERKILYAISKISTKDKIVKDDYFLINTALSDLINIGSNIDFVEPIRDFNGYSWTSISTELESVDHNLIYQNLRILLGQSFLKKWIKNNEFIIDYFDLFKEKIEEQYGKENKNKITELIIKISILLQLKFQEQKDEQLLELKEKVEQDLEKIQDKEKFIEETTNEKIKITAELGEIDTILNDKKLLEKEYKKRNKELPLDKKIFSMRILSKIMQEEREAKLNELETLNKMLNPREFVKYKKDLEEKNKYLKLLDIEDKNKELDKLKIELQKVFLNMLKININKADTKSKIEKIIYDFRYYMLLSYDYDTNISEVIKLKKNINEIMKLIINKAIELKVFYKISNDNETNYEILQKLFFVRIIRLEDTYLKITKENNKYFAKIFDENIFEEKNEISKPKDLQIKLDKKVPIFI